MKDLTINKSPVGAIHELPLQKDLPQNWFFLPLGDICKTIKGKKPNNTGLKSEERNIPYINIQAFETGQPSEFAEPRKYPTCNKDDVLIVWDGARAGLTGRGVSGYIGSTLAKIYSEPVENGYLFYFLKSQYKYLNTNTKGVGIPHIDPNVLFSIPFPLAPPDQQKLIVAEIEKQFSRLDEAVAALKRIQANLKRYKASVLKAAVEGKLTEEWRRKNPDVEPASELLKRILAERRKKWEEDYVKKYVAAHGHAPKDDSWKKRYKEPAKLDASNLPELPNGWVWATVEQLTKNEPNAIKAGPFGSSLKKSFYVPKGFKIYGQEQVLRDDPYFGDYYIDKRLHKKLKSCAVQPGDILISLVGTIGRVLILPKDIEPGIINPRLVKLSLDNRIINAKFIKAYIQSPYVKHLFSLSSHGDTMDILNLTILKEIPIPLLPLDEQNIIIEELEQIFSVEQQIELIIDANLKRAERLRQSILRQAFKGNLISQEVPCN